VLRRLIHESIAFLRNGKWLARRNGIFLIPFSVEAAIQDAAGPSHVLWPSDPVQAQGCLTAQPCAFCYLGAAQVIPKLPHAPLSASHDNINRHRMLRAEASGHEICREPPRRERPPCKQFPATAPIRVFRLFRGSSSLTQDPSPRRTSNDEFANQPHNQRTLNLAGGWACPLIPPPVQQKAYARAGVDNFAVCLPAGVITRLPTAGPR
jgi:hypothetical protein